MSIGYFLIYFVTLTSSEIVKVTVQQGSVSGTRETTVFDRRIYFAFYGIPYAKPPIGKLRFKNPIPPQNWISYDARTVYHGACAQAHIIHKDRVYGVEDCLRLNIYTPVLPKNEESELKPVIVWVHGYAFTSSFSHIYGGDFFIENDVLFVSVSHRLGAFGFLEVNNTDSNSNTGLKDIVMALKWIRKNIKKFGGDKKRITAMGSGSGATFLSLILTTKHKDLFSKVILQSGALYSPSIFQSDQNVEKEKFLKNLKLLGENNLIKSTTENIISASQKIYSRKEMINFQKPVVPFTPNIEIESNKAVLTKDTENIYNEIQPLRTNKPMMVGFNSQESISEMIPFLHNPHLLKHFETTFTYMVPFSTGCKFNYTSKMYNKVSEIIRQKYFRDKITEDSIENFLIYATQLHKYPIYKFIQNILVTKHEQLFMYKFNYIGKFNAVKTTSLAGVKRKIKGASNGDEICYLLKCEPLQENYVKLHDQIDNRDRKFIKKLTELWSNFAKTGNPTPSSYKGNITWLPATITENNLMVIGSENKLIQYSKIEHRSYEFWNMIYLDYYTNKHCLKKSHSEL